MLVKNYIDAKAGVLEQIADRTKPQGNLALERFLLRNRPRKFTFEKVCKLVPLVKRITKRYKREIDSIEDRVRYAHLDKQTYEGVAKQAEDVVRRWASHMLRLGVRPAGVFKTDFETGSGAYRWNPDEGELTFYCNRKVNSPKKSLV